jgi:hypothetical protein
MSQAHETWRAEHSIETTAAPAAIWALFRDVSGWKSWNAGVAESTLEGPFAEGSWFTMTPTGQDTLRSQLVDVRDSERFVDETRVGPLVVRVAHQIQRLDPERTRVTYAIEAAGPEASEIGPMIASDFPDVLASLARRAEG